MKTRPEIEVFEHENHCCDISTGSGPREKCDFMTTPTYCSVYQSVLKRNPDLYVTIKCDQCKADYVKALQEQGNDYLIPGNCDQCKSGGEIYCHSMLCEKCSLAIKTQEGDG